MFGSHHQETELPQTSSDLSLFEATFGDTYTLTQVNKDYFSHTMLRRLSELGFRPGITLQVKQRTSGNGRLVYMGSTRYALDKESAQNIYLTPEVQKQESVFDSALAPQQETQTVMSGCSCNHPDDASKAACSCTCPRCTV